MDTTMIESKINAGLADEQRTKRFAQMVRAMGEDNGQRAALGDEKFDAAVGEVVAWATEYIRHVPLILQEARKAAGAARILRDLEPFLDQVERYWSENNDVIPEHMGLVGVLDDAYYSLWMIQRFSESCEAKSGKPLISLDLSFANQSARQLIGSDFAVRIEQGVQRQLNVPALMQVLAAIGRFNSTLNTPDPIWGNASPQEIARIRLGAMGVI